MAEGENIRKILRLEKEWRKMKNRDIKEGKNLEGAKISEGHAPE